MPDLTHVRPSMGHTFDRAWWLTTSGFGSTWPVVVVHAGFSLLAQAAVRVLDSTDGDRVLLGSVTAGLLLFALVSFIALVAALDGHARGRRLTLNDALSVGFRKVIPSLVVTLLVALLVALLVGVGSVLLLVPGIAAAVYLAFAGTVIVVEGTPVVHALPRSVELVRGHWWRTFWQFLVLGLVLPVAMAAGAGLALGIGIAMGALGGLTRLVISRLTDGLVALWFVGLTLTMLYDRQARQGDGAVADGSPE